MSSSVIDVVFLCMCIYNIAQLQVHTRNIYTRTSSTRSKIRSKFFGLAQISTKCSLYLTSSYLFVLSFNRHRCSLRNTSAKSELSIKNNFRDGIIPGRYDRGNILYCTSSSCTCAQCILALMYNMHIIFCSKV